MYNVLFLKSECPEVSREVREFMVKSGEEKWILKVRKSYQN